jgi:hypothetical protein
MLSAKSEQCGSLQIVDAPNVRAHANTKGGPQYGPFGALPSSWRRANNKMASSE